ncbi:hypothetical protein A9Q84_05570 [Halobacteriovorax marinus]|uniref:Mannosyltransferase n=1 Tax=Halobacteriovorax marinus TaxID=97084 RepID=A0A1Y5FGR2_9BACT|nr:hypothetical protein A9Q84_05570 [Halobacteriovorax marinus]
MNIFKNHPIYLLTLLAITLCAIFSVGFLHPDEQYYTLDFAFKKLGILENLTTWEFETRIRPWTLPYFFYILLLPFKTLGITNPFTLATIARLFSGLLGFITLISFTKNLRRFFSEDNFKYFEKFSLLFWPLIFMSVRTSSDHWATCFFLLGLLEILKSEKISSKSLFIGGLLFGLSFSLRHQTGILSLSFGLWLLISKTLPLKRWLFSFSSLILLGVLIGIGLDSLGYEQLTFTPYNYLTENILKDKISGFGVMPWWGYLKLSLKGLNIFAPLLIIGAVNYMRKNPYAWATWIFIPFLVFHSAIGHKELRFLYPLLFIVIYMSFQSYNFIKYKKSFSTILFFSIIGTVIVCFKPAYTPMKFYHFLYNYKSGEALDLYTFKDRKGRYPELEMKVFERANTTLIKDEVKSHNPFYTFTTKYSDLKTINSKYQCTQEYISYPNWVLKFNFFKWRDRSNVWALSSCKQIP